MYQRFVRDTHTRWVLGPRAADFSIDGPAAAAAIAEHRPSVVLLASPNNPTGTVLPLSDIEAILGCAPGIVVVDEAYAEFRRPGTPSALTLLRRYPRLVVTRTMSKAFAFAGGRLGYLAAAPAVIDAVRTVRLPYHLSAVTQAVARAALAHAGELLARVAELRAERDAMVDWLRGIGLRAADSDANFALFGTFGPGGVVGLDPHAVWQGLLDRGVLIRETGPDGWLRVSIGTPEEMAAFRSALKEVLG
jgi:histidinol-phosphate aminotransferase